jgi:DNA-directed RNA polymerase subunit F
MNQQIEDKIVIRVLSRFSERSQVGIAKYKTTLERTDLSTLEWLTHAQEEAMDFVLYLERLKDEYNKPFTERLMDEMNKQQNEIINKLINNKNLKPTMPK